MIGSTESIPLTLLRNARVAKGYAAKEKCRRKTGGIFTIYAFVLLIYLAKIDAICALVALPVGSISVVLAWPVIYPCALAHLSAGSA